MEELIITIVSGCGAFLAVGFRKLVAYVKRKYHNRKFPAWHLAEQAYNLYNKGNLLDKQQNHPAISTFSHGLGALLASFAHDDVLDMEERTILIDLGTRFTNYVELVENCRKQNQKLPKF